MNNDFVVTKRKKEYIDQITQELRKKEKVRDVRIN